MTISAAVQKAELGFDFGKIIRDYMSSMRTYTNFLADWIAVSRIRPLIWLAPQF
jgi:hypothetical protein